MKLRYVAFAISTLTIGIGVAWAANPHFLYANSSIDAQGNLHVSFKEVGLGNPSGETGYCLGTDNERLGADQQCISPSSNPIIRERTFACVDPQTGQCFPSTAFVDKTSGAQFFSFDANGQNTQTLNPTKYYPQKKIACASKVLNPKVIKLRYSNITITDISNNVVVKVNPVELPLFECPSNP